jgi:hypothetical protein
MITDLEATEERLTVDDGDFLSIVADQISAGVALFFKYAAGEQGCGADVRQGTGGE